MEPGRESTVAPFATSSRAAGIRACDGLWSYRLRRPRRTSECVRRGCGHRYDEGCDRGESGLGRSADRRRRDDERRRDVLEWCGRPELVERRGRRNLVRWCGRQNLLGRCCRLIRMRRGKMPDLRMQHRGAVCVLPEGYEHVRLQLGLGLLLQLSDCAVLLRALSS
jgi:hypothetical protein